jgi:hypothetical protein
MITTHRSNLEDRCRERGYRLADVMGCVVSQDGDTWTIDENHPHYPRVRSPRVVGTKPEPCGGAGTELKALLRLVGITSTPTCKCNARAREMDARGVAWSEEHIEDTILPWLQEESKRRRLPFIESAARLMVKRAIRNARRKGYV